MNITVLGATGMAGTAIVSEATRRGHQVIAVSRRPKAEQSDLVTFISMDLTQPDAAFSDVFKDADAVVLTVRFQPGDETNLAPLTTHVLQQAKVTQARVLIVGGAGPLHSPQDHSIRVLDDPTYVPVQWRDIASASCEQFAVCINHQNQNWVYLSPPATFEPGAGTGNYRRGGDTLLLDADGASRITPQDLALAVLDELEHPQIEKHFTVIEGGV
ncbi:NAD(P)-dependent oxidoreductase [Corynebacterium glaucum]|uniref:NAD(P)-dependent oxidoreductase n=1 Tax=Corynebacterium glaucum TaxID=187491 RepID=UPI00265AFE9D|nr:NAD(P)H-binding protein [Corynebacterium glaucum]